MNTMKRRTIILIAAGAVGLAVAAVAVPAVAGIGPFSGPAVATAGQNNGNGNGNGNRGNGYGAGAGNGAGMATHNGERGDGSDLPATGTLTEQQRSTLAAITQEEKLAHDLYTAFAARYDETVFDRIAESEAQHLKMMRTLLGRYGLTDPTAGAPAGTFADQTLQTTYNTLLAQGTADVAAAMRAGQAVEQLDIDDIKKALNGMTAPDVTQVYTNLMDASHRHLAAFQR